MQYYKQQDSKNGGDAIGKMKKGGCGCIPRVKAGGGGRMPRAPMQKPRLSLD